MGAGGDRRRHQTHPKTHNWASPVEPGNLYANYVRPAVAGAGVGEARLHDFRHTFETLALSAGAHYMQVSKWLGHESYVTTLTIYADYIPEDEGGKAVPVARPATAEAPAQAEELSPNVVPFRRRSAG